VWEFVEFVLTALVFVLIGLQLRGILERLYPSTEVLTRLCSGVPDVIH
jgi:NhaP-type Na+/H+ or K+/H+ antiporter